MYGTLKKIFAFAGSKKGLLKKSLLFAFLSGLFSAMQFAALFVVIGALVSDNRDGSIVWISYTRSRVPHVLDVDIRTVRRLEDGTSKHGTEIFLKCVVTLRLSADICIYAPRDETGLLMHRLYQEMLQLTPEQIERGIQIGTPYTGMV